MARFALMLFTLLIAASFSPASASTYSWTDEQGTINFTEDLGSVPKKYRKKARSIQGDEVSPQENTAPLSAAKATQTPPSSVDNGAGPSPRETYGGKTYGQWEKGLREREDAMASVRKQVDEIDAQYKSGAIANKKFQETRNELLKQFSEMKAEYKEYVEAARKTGLQVNVPQ
jgi:hypothetical protein